MSSTQQTLRCLESSNGCQAGKHCDVDSPSAPSLTAVRRALPLAELSRSCARGIGFFRLTAQRRARYGSFGKAGSPRSGIPSTKVAQRILCFFGREERETPKRGGPAAPRCLATLLVTAAAAAAGQQQQRRPRQQQLRQESHLRQQHKSLINGSSSSNTPKNERKSRHF